MTKKIISKRIISLMLVAALSFSVTACTSVGTGSTISGNDTGTEITSGDSSKTEDSDASSDNSSGDAADDSSNTANVTSGGILDITDFFSDRDLEMEADTSDAETIALKDGEDITITDEGVYIISGSAENVTIYVEADDTAKVELLLDGATITNDSMPCIYVKSADKVFVTTGDSESTLSVTGEYEADGDTNLDAVIFSRSDLTLKGTGTLNIESTDNGISGKDDLKVTGGTYNISCSGSAVEANDSIRIADGTVNIEECNDGLHAENDEDDSQGFIYICGGSLNISAADDGVHGTSVVQIDGGNFDITAAEGIEGTYVQINDGTINISASDDGINAANKSSAYDVTAEFNGGNITIEMGQGDTDAIDVNGNLYINGGTIDITAQSPFDYDGTVEKNGGTLIINGEETEEITNQFMGGPGGGMGGMKGQDGNFPGGGMNGDGTTPPSGGMNGDGTTPPSGGMNGDEGRTPPSGGMNGDENFPGGGMKGGRGGRNTEATTETTTE